MTTSSISRAGCLTANDIDAFVRGRAGQASREAIEAHIVSCSACRVLLSALVKIERPHPELVSTRPYARPSDLGMEIGVGTRVGRYVLLEHLGEGAMGIVFSARDPELIRIVALKLLRADFDETEKARLGERLRREAQAMAQMAHPNVVTVYDVGTWGDRIFIAMEMVTGPTLSEWLMEDRRSWRHIVSVFLSAGHGLAAAHAAGLVHRDFKPANVLMGRDGRARVGDFGLASIVTDAGQIPADGAADERTYRLLLRSTVHSVAGTPYYMAPELFEGIPADTRSDQFSFCVALYTAVTGDHPLLQMDSSKRAESAVASWPAAIPRPGSMPRRLHRVLLRGLSASPSDRYPSMRALLDALAPLSRPRRLAAATWSGVAAALVLCILATVSWTAHRPHGPPWSNDQTVFAGAPDVREAYEREWLVMHTGACESPRARCTLGTTNLLRNAAFNRPDRAWRVDPDGGFASGVRLSWQRGAARMTATRSGGAIGQDVPWVVPPNQSYALRVWIRAAPSQRSARGRLVLSGVGHDDRRVAMTRFVAGPEWKPISVTFSSKAHFRGLGARIHLDAPGAIEIDNSELVNVGVVDASFEDTEIFNRTAVWRPYNFAKDVRARGVTTDAFDGSDAFQLQTAARHGSIAFDVPGIPVVGTTYIFSAWLRAGQSAPFVDGSLVLWGLGSPGKPLITGFRVSKAWTLVQSSLHIDAKRFIGLRAEIYLTTQNRDLDVDAASLTSAGLADSSFDENSGAWYLSDGSRNIRAWRMADASDRVPDGLFTAGRAAEHAKDGGYWLRMTRAIGGRVAQDIGAPLAGTTYTFAAWVRAAPGSPTAVAGSIAIRAGGGSSSEEEGRARFRVGREWTLVTATLDVNRHDHQNARVEIALDETAGQLDVDGCRLSGAHALPQPPASPISSATR
jgi:serine/threonine protein kinase